MKWKFYAWLLGTLFFVTRISDPEFSELSDIGIIREIITIVLILGTFCYAYQKFILTQNFWKFFLVVAAIDELLGLFETFENNEFNASFVFFLVIVYSLIIPAFIALYRYAFEADELWDKKN